MDSRLRAEQSRTLTVQEVFSHDIKNRLCVVLGLAQTLREGRLDRSDAARAIDAIEGSAHEAMTVVMNFLHAEENDGGSLRLHKTPASLNQITEQVIEDEAPRARLKRIDLQADLDPGLGSASVDVAMISHALTNLLNNAIHYSHEGGIVRVETRRFDDDIIVRVRDYGPGIPADEVPGLFQRYGRGAKAASKSSTGLGLYLVRTIAEAHGGSASVTLPPDGGAAFAIVLPCVRREGDA